MRDLAGSSAGTSTSDVERVPADLQDGGGDPMRRRGFLRARWIMRGEEEGEPEGGGEEQGGGHSSPTRLSLQGREAGDGDLDRELLSRSGARGAGAARFGLRAQI